MREEMINSNIIDDFNRMLDDKFIDLKMLARTSGINENEIKKILKNINDNDIKIATLLDFFKKTGFKIVFSLDGESTEDHSIGYILKDVLKRRRISKKKLSEILNEEYREVSLGIKNIYENKGDLKLLLKFTEAAGITFNYWFEK